MINGGHSVSGWIFLEGLAAALIMDLTTRFYTLRFYLHLVKRTRVTWFQFFSGSIFWNAAIGPVVLGQSAEVIG